MMTILACSESLRPIISVFKTIIRYIQILIPIALILLGTLDLGKAVIAQDEDKISAGLQIFIKRLIYAVIVFFVVAIVQLVMGLVADTDTGNADTTSWKSCWQEV